LTQAEPRSSERTTLDSRALLHLRFGWAALAVFVALGTGLEAMHGLKLGFYLDVSSTTRRFLWTLAHAHGALFSLVNVAYGLTLRAVTLAERPGRLASRCLIAATVLVPSGFFLGGIDTHGGDPGLATLVLVPPGAVLLLVAVVVTALHARALRPRG
jgi:hypothetical protein